MDFFSNSIHLISGIIVCCALVSIFTFFSIIFWENFKIKKNPEKPNKFAKISPFPFLQLAKKKPNTASKKLRERYDVKDDVQPSAIGGIFKDENSKGWHELARLLSSNDPTLSKSIYICLLRTRNYQLSKGISENEIADMRLVAQELYDLESRVPETKDEGKLAVIYALSNCSFPDQSFWQDSLEQTFELSLKLIKENGYHADKIAHVSFYAADNSELQKKALDTFGYLFKGREFFKEARKPESSKASLIYRLCNFCIQEHYSARNKSFAANPEANLLKKIHEVYREIIEEKLKEKSADALKYMERAMISDDTELSLEAGDLYKKHFEEIATQEPEEATENLRSLADFSTCTYSGSSTNHQPDLLMDVFDISVEALYKIDKSLAKKSFLSYVGSHKSMPQRIKQKHADKLKQWPDVIWA